ncbi:MAG: arylesterase/paraoxonase [Saprospiraceae bacterium]|jgi:arylesterase/paraoxonase
MKKIVLILLLIVGLLLSFVIYTMSSTGYFRSIEGSFEKRLISKVKVKGPEDIVISREDAFLIISSDDRVGHRDKVLDTTCGLYLYDLNNKSLELLDVKMDHELHPHGIDMMRIDSGLYRLLVINHVLEEGTDYAIAATNIHHYIEEFKLEGRVLTHIRSYQDSNIKSPNDVCILDETQFYFTNDHGSDTDMGLLGEDYLGWRRSGVVFYDGTQYKEVAGDIAYANGIAADQERNLLYVASPRDMLIKVFTMDRKGNLDFIEDIPCGTGVDNIELDLEGNLMVGCHPSLLHFSAYALGKNEMAPSEIIKIEYRTKSDYIINQLAEDDGAIMSAATVAIPYENRLYLGNVMDNHMVVLQNKK